MIQMKIGMTVTETGRENVMELIRGMLEPTRTGRGCLDCTLLLDAEQPDRLWLTSLWKTADDLLKYLNGPLFKRLLIAFESLSQAPAVCFLDGTISSGIKILHTALERKVLELGNEHATEDRNRYEHV